MANPRYRSLVLQRRASGERQVDALREEFDALHVQMQAMKSRQGVDRLLEMSAQEMNAMAVRRAPPRG